MEATVLKEIEKLKKIEEKYAYKDQWKDAAEHCGFIGEKYCEIDYYEEAIEYHERSLRLYEALEEQLEAAKAHRMIGEVFAKMEKFKDALKHQGLYLKGAELNNSDVEEQRAHATIGHTLFKQAEVTSRDDPSQKSKISVLLSKSLKHYSSSLDGCERLSDSLPVVDYAQMKARLYLNMGLAYDLMDDQGNSRKAIEHLKMAAEIAQKSKLSEELVRIQPSLAFLHWKNDQLSEALKLFDSALGHAEKVKDKATAVEVLTNMSIIHLSQEGFRKAKKCARKGYKMAKAAKLSQEIIEAVFKAVIRMEEKHEKLNILSPTDYESRMKLFEKMGDLAASDVLNSYKLAIRYYSKMLKCAEALRKPDEELAKIFVSLALTYLDDKQYTQAIDFYKKELSHRQGNYEQQCRTWLNIAELQELNKEVYEIVKESYLKAFKMAEKAQDAKLQVECLKSLSVSQEWFGVSDSQQETVERIETMKNKYGLTDDDIMSRDSQDDEDDDPSDAESDVDLDNHLSGSDASDNEEFDRPAPGRARRARAASSKLNEKGETPLHVAVISGNLKKVKHLIDQGHNVNPRDYSGWTPLHDACNNGHLEIVEYLLEKGALINDRGGEKCGGITPLHDACSAGHLDVANFLIRKGANVFAKDEDEGLTPLDMLRETREKLKKKKVPTATLR